MPHQDGDSRKNLGNREEVIEEMRDNFRLTTISAELAALGMVQEAKEVLTAEF